MNYFVLYNTLPRTCVPAFSAVRTQVVIDPGHVIFQLNCPGGTIFLTFFTADTSGVTFHHNHLALVRTAAGCVDVGVVGHQADQVLGTGRHALFAGLAFLLIHPGHAVDEDRKSVV